MIKNGEDIDIDEFEGPSQDLLLSLNEANAAGFIATYLELSLSEAPLVNNKLFVRFMIMSFTHLVLLLLLLSLFYSLVLLQFCFPSFANIACAFLSYFIVLDCLLFLSFTSCGFA